MDERSGSGRDTVIACPNALVASGYCRALADRWFSLHFSEFHVRQWTAVVSCLRATQLIWPACWVDTPDWSASSASRVYREELGTVPPNLVAGIVSMSSGECGVLVRRLVFFSLINDGRPPVSSGLQTFIGRGIYRSGGVGLGVGLLGSSGSSKLYWVSWCDDVDVTSAQCFVNSCLAPVLLRRRVESVADVLNGIRQNAFSQGRWDALHKAVCDHGPCGPLRSLEPWVHWMPPDLHGFSVGIRRS